MMRSKHLQTSVLFLAITTSAAAPALAQKNVLLLIADDLGVDVLNLDHTRDTVRIRTQKADSGTYQGFDLPNLSTLVANGVYFTNAWATPVCSPTRATIYTGRQPWRTGVGWPEGNYVLEDPLADGSALRTIANEICDDTKRRSCALFGKWHLGGDGDPVNDISKTPIDRGWDYYAGNLQGSLPAPDGYVNWTKYAWNRDKARYDEERNVSKYATLDVIDEAKEWIAMQKGTWFATLAFNAPHSPFHIPRGGYVKSTTTFNDKGKYNAMVQNLDHYIGKLWDPSHGPDINRALQNTVIIFVGDNGTPGDIADDSTKAKKTVYLGGVHVPMIIADGAKVVAQTASPTYLSASVLGKTESNQVNVADLFKTIIRIAGAAVTSGSGINAYDLRDYLLDTPPPLRRTLPRTFNFTQAFMEDGVERATISDGIYKLNYLKRSNQLSGAWELFNIVTDPGEIDNLDGDPAHASAQTRLLDVIARQRRNSADEDWP